jgi:hypothetical protein
MFPTTILRVHLHARHAEANEEQQNETSMTAPNDNAIRRALEAAGVEFIDENGGGPGVRLRTRQGKKSSRVPSSDAQ